jgi:hypothetical protein
VLLKKGAYRTGSRVLGDVRDEYGAHERVPCGLTFALEPLQQDCRRTFGS